MLPKVTFGLLQRRKCKYLLLYPLSPTTVKKRWTEKKYLDWNKVVYTLKKTVKSFVSKVLKCIVTIPVLKNYWDNIDCICYFFTNTTLFISSLYHRKTADIIIIYPLILSCLHFSNITPILKSNTSLL